MRLITIQCCSILRPSLWGANLTKAKAKPSQTEAASGPAASQRERHTYNSGPLWTPLQIKPLEAEPSWTFRISARLGQSLQEHLRQSLLKPSLHGATWGHFGKFFDQTGATLKESPSFFVALDFLPDFFARGPGVPHRTVAEIRWGTPPGLSFSTIFAWNCLSIFVRSWDPTCSLGPFWPVV